MNKFGVDPRERFAKVLRPLRDWGFAEIANDHHQNEPRRPAAGRSSPPRILPAGTPRCTLRLTLPRCEYRWRTFTGGLAARGSIRSTPPKAGGRSQLLDHSKDMTSTLNVSMERRFGVLVLDSRQDDVFTSARFCSLPAIPAGRSNSAPSKSSSSRFLPTHNGEILGGEMPLGHILRPSRSSIQTSREAFLQIEPDDLINRALDNATSRDSLRPAQRDHEHPKARSSPKLSRSWRQQLTVTTTSDQRNHFDAIIIGGGPAGASSAAVLAQYNHRVLVLEREKFPRYHIGESLLPFTFYPLQRLGFILVE